jgi:SpoVK/Ycf46/Vps4 family AAA+-type ATPase
LTTPIPVLTDGYSYPVLLPLVRHCLKRGVSILLRGSPGVGKSALAAELAHEMGLPMFDIRLAQKDPAELGGVYVPNREKKILELYPPDWVQQICETPAFLFLDEINAAVSKLHQAAAYQIILEHRVGASKFHEQTVVMAAGNLEEDETLAVPLSSALQNRFAHYTLKVDADAWITWATAQQLSPDIVGYIAFRREPALYKRTGEYAFATPRSWEIAARVDGQGLKDRDRKRLLVACVGQAAATEFQAFYDVYRHVDVPGILDRGDIPDLTNAEPAFVYALCFSVGYLLRGKGLKKAQAPHLLALLQARGFGPEFQVLLLKCIQGSKAFNTLLEDPLFDPIKASLVRLLTETQEQLL